VFLGRQNDPGLERIVAQVMRRRSHRIGGGPR
jgi:hypothetical protein